MSSATDLRRTPLYDRHAAAGAKLVPFAGWEMPVQYAGIREEHIAVRTGAGVFDVSHMGQVLTRGPQATDFLQRMLSNDVRRIPEGGAQYSVMCREDGGVLDDLFTYRLADTHFLTITNAANHDKDLAWLQSHTSEFDVDVIDRQADYAMLAVQGPRARSIVQSLADGALCRVAWEICDTTLNAGLGLPAKSTRPFWLKGGSARGSPPEYCTGISQPANGTILAPSATC